MVLLLKIGIFIVVPAIVLSVLLVNRFSELAPAPTSAGGNANEVKDESAELPVEISFENKALDTTIDDILKAYPEFETSISIQSLSSGAAYNYGDSSAYYAASTTKLISIADYLTKVEQGEYSLASVFAGDTADNQIKKMVYYSDNTAWTELRQLLSHQDINNFALMLGMTSFNSSENLVSSADMAAFLAKLHQGQILNPENTRYLLDLMAQGDQNYPISLGLPAEAKDYHKNGWLPDRLNLALIVENGQQKFAVAIFSNSAGGVAYDFAGGKIMIKQIVQAITSNLK